MKRLLRCIGIFAAMHVAVFLYADDLIYSDVLWLQHWLQALVQQDRQHTLLVFTNVLSLSTIKNPNIIFPEWQRPNGLLVRQRTLHRWRQQATQHGADVVVCVGRASVTAIKLPIYLLLLSEGANTNKLGPRTKSSLAGVWVTSKEIEGNLVKKGIQHISVLPGGPFYTAGDTNVAADLFREQQTDGCAYFLYAGPISDTPNLIGLLKAFSRFKHRQKTSWKLVLLPLGKNENGQELKTLLATYKYRSEVIMPEGVLDTATIANYFAAAYAFVQPLPVGPLGNFLGDAIGAGLPVIATSNPSHKEWAGNAALYYTEGDEDLLASCLMQVYKDESLHRRLADAANESANQSGWLLTATTTWQALAIAEK